MARKSIDSWIHDCLTDTEKEGKCTRIVLCFMVGMGRTEIHTQKFAKNGSYQPKDLANMFIGKADVHCQDMRGEHRFTLDAYWETTEAQAFMPFVRKGQVENSSGLAYQANEEGRLAQKMEMDTALMRQVYHRQERMDAYQAAAEERGMRREEQLYGRLEHVMTENFKFFTMIKDLMVAQTLDNHKLTMEKLQFERGTQREAKLMEAAPILTNMALGREVFPQSMVDTKIVEALAKKVTPEIVSMLSMLGLSDEETGILMHRINQVKEKEEKESAHRAQLPKSSLSGEEELTPNGETH